MTSRRRSARASSWWTPRRAAVVSTLSVACLLRLVGGGGSIGYDAAYALAWGEDLLAGRLPDYGGAVTPTPHPLLNAVGLLAALLGPVADEVLLAIAHVAFGALVVVGAVLAARLAGPLAGAVVAATLLTRAAIVDNTLDAGIDAAFAALVVGALASELRAPHSGRRVLALLALAGCLRPDAWLLSLAYLVYRLARRAPDATAAAPACRRPLVRWQLVLLAGAAPAVWMGCDLLVTSDPLYSLTATRDLAAELARPRGAARAAELLPEYLTHVAGSAAAWVGALGALAALWLAPARAQPTLAVLVLGCVAFLGLGLAGLPLIIRYAFLPAIVLCVFCGVLAALPGMVPARRGATWGCAVAVIALLALELPSQLRRADHVIEATAARAAIQRDLERLTKEPAVRAAVRACGRVWSTSHRPIPLLAVWLDRPTSRFETGSPERDDRGVVVDPATVRVAQQFRLRGADGRVAPARLTAGFVEIARTESWRAYRRCDATS